MKNFYSLNDELQAKGINIEVKDSNLYLTGNKSALTQELITTITEQKTAFIEWLSDKKKQNLGLAVTAGQHALWSLSQLHSNHIHNLVKIFKLHQGLNQQHLSQNLLQLIHNHQALKSVYRIDSAHNFRQFELTSFDFQITYIDSNQDNLSEDISNFSDMPFNLSADIPIRAALFTVSDTHYFVLVLHHIAVDYSSYQILLEQLATLMSGVPVVIEDKYQQFIYEKIKYNTGPEKSADKQFWQKTLSNLPSNSSNVTSFIFSHTYHYVAFDEFELQPKIKAFSQSNHLTPFNLFLSVFSLLRFFSTGESNVIVGTPADCRNSLWTKKIIGFLANVIPVHTVLNEKESLKTICQNVAQTISQCLTHQALPLSEMPTLKSQELIQAMFVWHPDISQSMQLVHQHIGEEIALIPSIRGIHENILLITSASPTHYNFQFYFKNSIFSKEKAELFVSQFKLLYQALINNEEQTVEDLLASLLLLTDKLPPSQQYEHCDFYQPVINKCMSHSRQNDKLAKYYELLHNQCLSDSTLYNTATFEQRLLQLNSKVKLCKLISKKQINGRLEHVIYFIADELLNTQNFPELISVEQQTISIASYIQVKQVQLMDTGHYAWHTLEHGTYLNEKNNQFILEQINQNLGFSDVRILTEEQVNSSSLFHLHEFSRQSSFNRKEKAHRLDSLEQNTDKNSPLALQSGAELIIDSQAPITLSEAFRQTVLNYPDKGIYHYNRQGTYFQSYKDLYKKALHILAGLQAQGLKPQDKIILQIPDLAEHLSVFWAAILGGIIPVTVAIPPSYATTNGIVEKLMHVWSILEQPLLITSQAAKANIQQLVELHPELHFNIAVVEDLESPNPSNSIYSAQPADVVFYQLTSGSTGKPKCIQETHAGIIAHIHGSSQTNDYHAADISLNWLPLDHVVPTLTYHLKNVYLGCTQIEVLTDLIIVEPTLWLDLIEKYAVTLSWSPNFGFKLLTEALKKESKKTWNLSSLRFLMNAGEQVTPLVCNQFLNLVAKYGVNYSVMQPAFGMAEACTCMTYLNNYSPEASTLFVKKNSLLGYLEPSEGKEDSIGFVSLGTVMPGVSIRITDSNNQVLPELVIGRFQIQGAVITPGYYANPSANQEAFTSDGWFDSGDLGFIYQKCLYLTGRQKETIIINGANFYCYEIEDLVNTIPGVMPTFTAACGVPDNDSGSEILALFFVPTTSNYEEQLQTITQIRQAVSKHHSVFARHIIPLTQADLKKTTSGKIQRQEIKANFLKGLYTQSIKLDKHFLSKEVVPDWFYKEQWHRCDDPVTQQFNNEIHFISQWDNDKNQIIAKLKNHASIILDIGKDNILMENIYRTILDIYQTLSPLTKNWTGLQFYVIGYKLFQVIPEDSNEKIMHTGLHSLLKTMSLESSSLHCRLIDIDDTHNLKRIVQLECNVLARKNLVAYRHTQRYTLSLTKITAPKANNHLAIQFKPRVFYLLIGGLGGIGKELSRELNQRYDAHILIIGRQSSNVVAADLESLKNQGVECAYQTLDLNTLSPKALNELCEYYTQLWKRPLHGVLHLAGSFPQRLLSEESTESIMSVVNNKIAGLESIKAFLVSQKEVVFIAFSSVNSFFGGVNSAAYAIANQIFTAKIHHLFANSSVPYRNLSWSMWRDAGMGKDYEYKELAQNKGFHLISNQQGLISMAIALAHHEPHLHIGIDCSKPYMAQMIIDEQQKSHTLLAYRTKTREFTQVQFDAHNHYGQIFKVQIKPSRYYSVAIQHQIQLAQRKILLASDMMQTSQAIPVKIIEKTKKIWQEVLDQEEISIHSNFFDLGGNSLDIIRIKEQLTNYFAIDIPVAQLFNSPTIATLASMISNQLSSCSSNRTTRKSQRGNQRTKRPSPKNSDLENLFDEL